MVPILAVAFILVPLAELAVLIAVGDVIGLLPTLVLLLVVSVAGAWLAKREGLAAWRRFQLALAGGRVPTVEVADGAMILLAGALLLTPGFLSDAVGLFCILPFTRPLARRVLTRVITRRLSERLSSASPAARRPGTTPVVRGEVVDDERT